MSSNIFKKEDQQVSTENFLPMFGDTWQKTFYHNTSSADSIQSQAILTTTTERDKMNCQLTGDIFDRLLKFGVESDRLLFCQRLQTIWEEQGIVCQSYPTITNQILDLYKLHHLVQEKQGYLEITTNRGWKEISNILGFGDSGSAAYSVKRNYVRLGLLAYECRFDRAGLDPRSVIELSEMPHTSKKRKRGNHTSTTRAVLKANKQQLHTLSMQHEHDDTKRSVTLPISIPYLPKSSSHYQNFSYSFRLTPQQMPIHDFEHFAYILRAGWLADSNKYLDTLLVWLSDPRTASYFNLKYSPGLFDAITEQYTACLYELFGQAFLQASSTNDCYMDWFLQSKLRINDSVIGPHSDQQRLESLFFGTYRYVLRQLMEKKPLTRTCNDMKSTDAYKENHQEINTYPTPSISNMPGIGSPVRESLEDEEMDCKDHQQHTDRYHSIMIRCSCLSTIVRNLSFIEENEHLANDRRLVDILERILNCHHRDMHEIFDYDSHSHQQCFHKCSDCSRMISDNDIILKSPVDSIIQGENANQFNDFSNAFIEPSAYMKTDNPLACTNDCDQRHLMYVLDNTFITLSNLSTCLELGLCYPVTRQRLINTIIHWIACPLSFANEPFISMIMEDKFPMSSITTTKKREQTYISPRQISLQILAQLCTNEINVDLILFELDFPQLQSLSHVLLSLMNSSNSEDINREYCLLIICSLCKRHRQLVEFFCSHMICIELLFNYLEFYEYHQQQYLIATLTSYCNATTSPNLLVNHSVDMMIDSCVQLLLLFAPMKENNCLKAFEYRLVDMSSSIYFEQRILKAFADILYIVKS